MNIYEFINSRDMRTYLQEINYRFTTPEAAFVVYWCKKKTLDEKIKAWQEIVNTMPDCSVDRNRHLISIDSFHSFLKEYIALLKQDIQNFVSDEGAIYSCSHHAAKSRDSDCYWKGNSNLYFSDYASCLEYSRRMDALGAVDEVRICKYLRHQTADTVEKIRYADYILLNRKMEIMEISIAHEEKYDADLESVFEKMCFAFPTPFKRGDILAACKVHQAEERQPFVLSYLTTWDSKEMMGRGFKEHECPGCGDWEWHDKRVERALKNGDFTNMHAIGMCVNNGESKLYIDNTLIIPIDLEYYREPLKRAERQLQVFSCYEKGKIDSEMLVNCCHAIRMDLYFRKSCGLIYR